MNIINAMAVKNDCYKKATPMKPVGIVVHSTGANNPNLKRYVDCEAEVGKNQYGNTWNQPTPDGRQVCVHAFIGYDKNNAVRVAQILPYTSACWGVGSGTNGSYNYNPVGHIQFEMCEDDLTNGTYFSAIWNTAVEYCAELCKQFGFDPLGKNVIVSHKEAHDLGYGSNHGDPHNWFNKFGKTMNEFRQAVKTKMGGTTEPAQPPVPSTPTTPSGEIKAGALVKIASAATYYDGKQIPAWVQVQNWFVKSVSGDRAVIDKNENGTNSICSPVNVKFLSVVGASTTPALKSIEEIAKEVINGKWGSYLYTLPTIQTADIRYSNHTSRSVVADGTACVGVSKNFSAFSK